jgi:DNA-binding transcriptional LysR family regulator
MRASSTAPRATWSATSRSRRGLELGELRIGVGPYGGSALVGPALGRLNYAHPGLRLKTVLAPWQELPDRARARDVDLIVVELSQVQLMDDFAVQALTEHAWWWCASRGTRWP